MKMKKDDFALNYTNSHGGTRIPERWMDGDGHL